MKQADLTGARRNPPGIIRRMAVPVRISRPAAIALAAVIGYGLYLLIRAWMPGLMPGLMTGLMPGHETNSEEAQKALRSFLTALFGITAAAVLHESGHWLAVWACGAHLKRLTLDVFGASMEVQGFLSYGQEFFLASAGVVMNFLSAAWAFPLFCRFGAGEETVLYHFLVASVGFGCLNLLPVGNMDGGRMLYSLLAGLFGLRTARFCLCLTTHLCLLFLFLLSAYALLRSSQMLTLFVFSLFLLFRFSGEQAWNRLPHFR